MAKATDFEVTCIVDSGINHDVIADTLDTLIFYGDESDEAYKGAEDFLECQIGDYLESYPETVERLHLLGVLMYGEGRDGRLDELGNQAFQGGITAFSILDAMADQRGVDKKDYRRFWLRQEHIANDDAYLDFCAAIDDPTQVTSGYFGLAHKIANEVTANNDEYEAFIETFMAIMATGKQAMAKMILSDAGAQTAKIMTKTDLDKELVNLLSES